MVSQRLLWRLRVCSRHRGDLAHERFRCFLVAPVTDGHCRFVTILATAFLLGREFALITRLIIAVSIACVEIERSPSVTSRRGNTSSVFFGIFGTRSDRLHKVSFFV